MGPRNGVPATRASRGAPRGDDNPMSSDRPAPLLWGPLTRFGLVIVLLAAAVDQAAKFWLLYAVDLPARGIVRLTPFLDLVLTWNTGISWGLFRQQGPLGQGRFRGSKRSAGFCCGIWWGRAASRWRRAAPGVALA